MVVKFKVKCVDEQHLIIIFMGSSHALKTVLISIFFFSLENIFFLNFTQRGFSVDKRKFSFLAAFQGFSAESVEIDYASGAIVSILTSFLFLFLFLFF